MKPKQYLSDHALLLWLLALGVISVEILLLHYEVELWLRLLMPLIIFICAGIGLLYDYTRRRYYYENLFASLQSLENKYLIHALETQGDFTEARLLEEILYTTGKAMAENVNLCRREQEEYGEYMELWVHDIKLPIAAAKLVAENNKSSATDSIDEELDKIDSMTENVLYYARSGCVEQDYLIRRCQLKELVGCCVRANKKYLIREHFAIHIENCDLTVYTDPKWTQFILGQLVSNSIKYASDSPSLTFSAEQKKESIILSVIDNGKGIPSDEIDRIFEKGFTGSSGRSEGSKSTGIGLYLCRKLCDKLGIGIAVSSKPGEGTAFLLTFPQESFYSI